MIILHFHLLPQFKYELFHIYFTSLHILRFIGGNIYNGEFPTLRMEALILAL